MSLDKSNVFSLVVEAHCSPCLDGWSFPCVILKEETGWRFSLSMR